MKKIYKLTIKNFKAFQDEEVFEFKGKNVLVYGNNGSGKSSLFWALYTFLQSSIKLSDEEIEKYFDSTNHQSLLNIFMQEDTESKIEMTYIDEQTQETHSNIISKETINTRNNQTIQELNLASDFINYKLLHNFYNASHKEEVNLWSVFERDIFPFYTDGTTPILDKIKNKTQAINGRKTQSAKTRKESELNEVNVEIETLLTSITDEANRFLKKHFYDNKDVIKINLEFKDKFTLQNINEKLWSNGNDPIRQSKLHIKLSVEQHMHDDEWKELHRVQSFLNEAQLTRIAIAIRIGALRSRVQGTDFKILVLDDMLNSLDMSNRVDVMRIILNKENNPELQYFDTYQKIILTHDKGFFDLIRRHTSDEGWVYYKFIKDETKNDAPKINKDLRYIDKAERYFLEGEFDSCGNELRKEAESIFANYLNPTMQKLQDEFEPLSDKIKKVHNDVIKIQIQNFKQVFVNSGLNLDTIKKIKEDIDLIPESELSTVNKSKLKSLRTKLLNYLIKQYETNDNKEKLILETKEILDRVLNSASHHNDNPLHSQELKNAITHMISLKAELENN